MITISVEPEFVILITILNSILAAILLYFLIEVRRKFKLKIFKDSLIFLIVGFTLWFLDSLYFTVVVAVTGILPEGWVYAHGMTYLIFILFFIISLKFLIKAIKTVGGY